MTWRRGVLAVTVVALLALLAAYLTVTLTYAVERGSEGGYAVLDPAGDRIRVAVSVRNPGPVPVTLDAVTVAAPFVVVEETTMLAHAGRNPSCCRPELAEPFRPLTIDSHGNDEALVWLVLRRTGGPGAVPCSPLTVDAAQVSYRVLGMRRTQRLALPVGPGAIPAGRAFLCLPGGDTGQPTGAASPPAAPRRAG